MRDADVANDMAPAAPAGVAARRRQELGMFLRSRRERTAPHHVGLPSSGRRRTPGLRREELAVLAGISTTWYTFLEQGRDVRASGQVLAAIARALRLDGAECDHLLALAGDAAEPLEQPEYLSPEVARVPRLLLPNPAYVTGSSLDLLSWNDAAAEFFRGLGPAGAAPPNLARWVFTDPAARDVLLDWEAVATGLLARLRANAGRHPGSLRFRRLVRELRENSPEADAWWPRYDIAASQTGTKRIRRPDGVAATMTYASFLVAENSEYVLTAYHPG